MHRRGCHPHQGQRDLLQDRGQDGGRPRHGSRRQGRGDHRHRILRIVGRNSLRGAEPDRGDRRTHGSQGEDCSDDPRMPGKSVQPAGYGPPIRDSRNPSRARREGKAQVGVRASDPRGLSAAGPFRRRPLREKFGDEGHRQGYCLYKLGCKGPATHANCSLLHFGETDTWPIGIGHPCAGCTEQKIAFRVPVHTTIEIDRPTPPTRTRRSTPSRVTSAPWPPAWEASCAERSWGRGGWRPRS